MSLALANRRKALQMDSDLVEPLVPDQPLVQPVVEEPMQDFSQFLPDTKLGNMAKLKK